MDPKAHIFREYDIRGIVGSDLTESVTAAVGRAYATLARERIPGRTPTVVVGRDNRPSSDALAEALITGLRSSGADVIAVGTVPTPVLYWAEHTLQVDGGIQITGSHNPPEYNGIKMTLERGSLYGATIQELRRKIDQGDFADGQGARTDRQVLEDYRVDLAGRFTPARSVKVAVDCGNGSGALVAVPLLEALGAEVTPLYCESDGTFPNHHPDPTVDENLTDLIARVRDSDLELGVAFDGDADRIGVVDENGSIVRGDVLLLLFGLDILERLGPGQKLIFDVKCSQVVPDVYSSAGGEPIMWMTGHSLMKKKMKETGAPLAGELSGHICFADAYLGIDDAPYAACRLLDLLARADRPLSAMVGELPQFVSTPELRIDVTEESKFRIVDAALDHFRKEYDVIDVDGVRILFGDGWGLIRASNTQPVLVARYEARTWDRLQEIRDEVESWLVTQGVDV